MKRYPLFPKVNSEKDSIGGKYTCYDRFNGESVRNVCEGIAKRN